MRYKINDLLIKLLYRKLRLPKSWVYNSLIAIKKLSPQKKQNYIKNTSNYDNNPNLHSGYSLFNKKDYAGIGEVIDACNTVYHNKRSQHTHSDFQNNPKKNFLLTIDSNESLLSLPEINKFITSSFVIDQVSSILQSSFIINSARLWWTPANSTECSSQLYHFDEEDLTQVKLFVNIMNVSKSNGPFTFLPSDLSTIVTRQYRNGKRRYSDQEVYKHIDKKNAIQLVGDAGSGAFYRYFNVLTLWQQK